MIVALHVKLNGKFSFFIKKFYKKKEFILLFLFIFYLLLYISVMFSYNILILLSFSSFIKFSYIINFPFCLFNLFSLYLSNLSSLDNTDSNLFLLDYDHILYSFLIIQIFDYLLFLHILNCYLRNLTYHFLLIWLN